MGFQFIDRSNSTTKTGLLKKQTQLNCSSYTTSQTLFCVIDLQRTRVMKEKVHELYWCFVWLVFSCDETIPSDSTSRSNTLDFTNRWDQSSTHLTRHKSASGETCSSETDVTCPVLSAVILGTAAGVPALPLPVPERAQFFSGVLWRW